MTETIHAAAVEIDGKALLILGSSGSGKSSLALDLIALGARLIGDDLIRLTDESGALTAASAGRRPPSG